MDYNDILLIWVMTEMLEGAWHSTIDTKILNFLRELFSLPQLHVKWLEKPNGNTFHWAIYKNVENERKDGTARERERERGLYKYKNTNSSSMPSHKSTFLIVSSLLCKFELMQIHLSTL